MLLFYYLCLAANYLECIFFNCWHACRLDAWPFHTHNLSSNQFLVLIGSFNAITRAKNNEGLKAVPPAWVACFYSSYYSNYSRAYGVKDELSTYKIIDIVDLNLFSGMTFWVLG